MHDGLQHVAARAEDSKRCARGSAAAWGSRNAVQCRRALWLFLALRARSALDKVLEYMKEKAALDLAYSKGLRKLSQSQRPARRAAASIAMCAQASTVLHHAGALGSAEVDGGTFQKGLAQLEGGCPARPRPVGPRDAWALPSQR
jgi:hypothetical protein